MRRRGSKPQKWAAEKAARERRAFAPNGTPCPVYPDEATEVCGDADPSKEPSADECETAPLCRDAMAARARRGKWNEGR